MKDDAPYSPYYPSAHEHAEELPQQDSDYHETLLLITMLLVVAIGVLLQKALVFFVGCAAAIGIAIALGRRNRKSP